MFHEILIVRIQSPPESPGSGLNDFALTKITWSQLSALHTGVHLLKKLRNWPTILPDINLIMFQKVLWAIVKSRYSLLLALFWGIWLRWPVSPPHFSRDAPCSRPPILHLGHSGQIPELGNTESQWLSSANPSGNRSGSAPPTSWGNVGGDKALAGLPWRGKWSWGVALCDAPREHLGTYSSREREHSTKGGW